MTSAIRDAAPARALPRAALGEWLKRRGKWLIILPPLLFLLVFFLIPFGFALVISFADTAVRVPPFTDILSVSPDWHIHLTLNLGNFRYLFTDEVYGLSYLYSLKTAFFSTLICLALGYPMAYAIARTSKSTQSVLLLIVILPFWTSFLLLPLFATLEKLDHSLLEAAADLGSPPWRTFVDVTLPLSMPGVIAGSMLVFIPAIGEFVIPTLLGGPDNLMIGRVLWDEFFGNRDWPVASAVAIAFLVLLVGPIALYQHYNTKQLES